MSMEVTAWNALYNAMHAQQDTRPFSRATLRRIFAFAQPHRRYLVAFTALSIVTAVLAVATPVLAGRVVDAIMEGSSQGYVIGLAVVIAVIAVAEAGVGLVQRWLSASIGEGLILDLRQAVFDHVQKMPVAFFTRTRTGALVSRLNNDVIGAQRAFSDLLSGVVSNVVMLVLALVVMLGISWQITLLALALLPVFVLPARRMGGKLARLEREAANHNAVMGTQMTERFSAPGATLVKLFSRPERESAEFSVRARRVRDIGLRTAMVQWIFVTALTLVGALALALVYGLGGFYALRDQLDAGAVVSMALLLTRLYAPLTALASARVEVMSALVSFARVFEVLDLKPLIVEKPDARSVPAGPVAVEFDDVHFSYPAASDVSLASLEEVAMLDTRGGDEVLHGVSFTAAPGEMVALVGSSGAGKSTIAQLLPRLYDVDSGAIRLNGVDVRDLTTASVRETLGMVTQDGHLFHESIRENLLIARPSASDDELWDVLRRSRLEALVASLPDGLDTVVGERGYRLSGGERQRLTIARLLLARPRVVILDEATAHLDSTSEAAVQEALGEALEGRTAVVIAHRLSTVRSADQILVIEAGRVVERGTHPELLSASGRYAQLYRTQFDQPAADHAAADATADNVLAGAGPADAGPAGAGLAGAGLAGAELADAGLAEAELAGDGAGLAEAEPTDAVRAGAGPADAGLAGPGLAEAELAGDGAGLAEAEPTDAVRAGAGPADAGLAGPGLAEAELAGDGAGLAEAEPTDAVRAGAGPAHAGLAGPGLAEAGLAEAERAGAGAGLAGAEPARDSGSSADRPVADDRRAGAAQPGGGAPPAGTGEAQTDAGEEVAPR